MLLSLPKKAREALDEDGAHQLWRWMEEHGEWVFPLIGLAILALVVWAVRRGSISQAEELHKKGLQKEQIIRLMRLKLSLTAETAAAELGIDHFAAAALLEEMLKEGRLVAGRSAGGVASYRLKGL